VVGASVGGCGTSVAVGRLGGVGVGEAQAAMPNPMLNPTNKKNKRLSIDNLPPKKCEESNIALLAIVVEPDVRFEKGLGLNYGLTIG